MSNNVAERPESIKSSGYSSLIPLSGAIYLPLTFVARLPLSMLAIGLMTLVTATTGSYALGGLAAAMVGIGSAVGGPSIGYLADRFGQRQVLLPSAVMHTVMLAAAAWYGSQQELITPAVLVVVSFLAGATGPQVSPMSRVRWIAMTQREKSSHRVLTAAMGFESTADELGFVIGPVAVGLLASLLTPYLPLIIAAVLTIALVPAFALHRTESSVVRAAKTQARSVVGSARIGAIGLLVLGMVALGTVFGSTAAGTLAFAGSLGDSNQGGILYGAMGASSAIAALSVAMWPQSLKQINRWILCGVLMTATSLLLPWASSAPAMLAALFIVGFAVGPVIVTVMTLGGEVAPSDRLSTVMTLLSAGIVVGTAIGNGMAGAMAESQGYAGAFLVASGAAAVIALSAVAMKVLVGKSAQLRRVG